MKFKDPIVSTAAAQTSVDAAAEKAVATVAVASGVSADAQIATRRLPAAGGTRPAIPGSFIVDTVSPAAADAMLKALQRDGGS